MLFSSIVFIFIFLPAILLLYYLSPRKIRNYLLFIFSITFYAWGGVSYTLVLLASVLFNYLFARKLSGKTKHRKRWFTTGLIFNISLLVVFKYLDFFVENINDIGLIFIPEYSGLSQPNIVLPLGISFFTFQQMSMIWDIYRNPEVKKLRFINTALYISFFPQLIAGPIVRYNDIIEQIKNRSETIALINSGIQRFILGLFKKIVFANSCGALADSIMDSPLETVSTPVAWLGVIAYAFQIYFDFSGYSDMAIGLARMFGFRILENFNFPYISRSIKEFWRRWHISLSSWFRDYVYIPLGGNRLGSHRTYFNLLVVFLLTGFWHGATWSFVFWGIYHGTFLIIERLGFERILNKLPRVISWGYMMVAVLIGWVFFRIENFPDALKYIGILFGAGGQSDALMIHYLDRESVIILTLAALSSTTVFLRLKDFLTRILIGKSSIYFQVASGALLMFMFLYSVLLINSGSYNPFIYFRF